MKKQQLTSPLADRKTEWISILMGTWMAFISSAHFSLYFTSLWPFLKTVKFIIIFLNLPLAWPHREWRLLRHGCCLLFAGPNHFLAHLRHLGQSDWPAAATPVVVQFHVVHWELDILFGGTFPAGHGKVFYHFGTLHCWRRIMCEFFDFFNNFKLNKNIKNWEKLNFKYNFNFAIFSPNRFASSACRSIVHTRRPFPCHRIGHWRCCHRAFIRPK